MKTKNKSFKRLFAFLVALVMVTALVPSVIFAADPTFSDVPASHWSYDYIEKLAAKDVVGGYADGTFGPRNNVTRQQAAKMIALAAELKLSPGYEADFSDMDKVGASFVTFVNTVAENKVVGGYPDGTFKPLNNIKRSQAAKMIVLAFGLEKGSEVVKFDDAVADATGQSYIDILASNGIVKGYEEGGKTLYKPYNNVTREQLAKMIVEAMELEDPTFRVVDVRAINAKEVEIKFSKAVDESTVVTAGTPDTLKNITFSLVGAGQSITSGSAEASLSEDGKTLTVVATTGEYFDGQYAVLVPVAVTDVDGNAVEAYSSVVTLKDTVRPTVGTATYPNNNTVKFEFSEPINLANGAALEAVSTLKDKNGAVVSNAGLITLAADKKSFEVNIAGAGFVLNDNFTLTIVGAADFAGNLITPNPVTVNLVKTNADTVKPEITSVTAVNNTNLIVKFSEPINTTGTYFTLDVAQSGVAVNVTTAEATVNKDKTEVNVDLTNTAFSSFTFTGLKRIDIAGYNDLSGNPGNAFNKLVTFTADTDAPEVEAVTVETIGGVRYIAVKYNEDVTLSAADLTPVTYVADGVQKTLTGNKIDSAAVIAHTDANIKDTILINTEDYDNAGTVLPEGAYKITLPATLVADAAPNTSAVKVIEVTVGTLSPTDTTKPGISSVTLTDNDTVTVVFSEEVSNETALNTANYTIDGVQVVDSAIFQGDKTTVKLTLKDGIIGINGGRLFEIKNVADKAGNVMNAYSDTKTFTENVKPQMLSAQVVDTDEVLVTFSEGLLASSVATGDFTVKINGTTATVSTVTKADGNALANGDTKVLLTITPAITATSDVVTVEIADGVIDDVNNNSNDGAKTVTAQ